MDSVTSRRGLAPHDLTALVREVLSQPLSDRNRPIRLRLGDEHGDAIGKQLLAQRIDIHESLCGGITAHITCLSPRCDLPLESLLGVPIEVQLVTDRGGLRRFCVIVTEAQAGASDGGLALFQLTGRDALAVMEQRINSRVFRRKSVVEISEIMLTQWRQRSASMARTFDFKFRDLSELMPGPPRYPEREFTLQYNESDAAFLRRLWKRAGIGWYFTSAAVAEDDTPQQRLVLYDDSWQLPQNAAGALRFHRDAATEKRDAITVWAPVRRLVPASVRRPSWDYIDARLFDVDSASALRQGAAGDRLAALLQDAWIESPHTGASGEDHRRLTTLRQRRHDSDGGCVHGMSGVRDLAAGEWNLIEGQSELDRSPASTREHLFIDVHHWADNNLPKALDERVQSLLGPSEALPGWRAAPSERRYQNRFIAVRRDILYVPPWNPAEDWPAMPPLTALVVGPKGEEVHCDSLGRIKLRLLGLDPQDHAHDHGAGTNDDDSDSAWVRVDFGWAGRDYGHIHPLRVGMEVQVQFINGDPDRPVVTGVVYNRLERPAQFSHIGELPGNRYLSGTVTREIDGERGNQLRFDDTPGQISAQLASDHGQSQLNLGHLTHPRRGGAADARGEGIEGRSDGAAAWRGKRGALISADAQERADGSMLDCAALVGLTAVLHSIQQELSRLAVAHAAGTVDGAALAQAMRQLESWSNGSNIAPNAAGGGAPMVAVSAPAGITVGSGDGLLLGAQSTVDIVSAGPTQISAAKDLQLQAGQGLHAFAHANGISVVSAQGDIDIRADKDEVVITAAKRIVLRAGDEIVLEAPKIRQVAQGVQVDLGGGAIQQQCSGDVTVKSAAFSHVGPGDGSPASLALPATETKTDERFVLKLRGSGAAVVDRRYRIDLDDGRCIEGRSDARGRTQLARTESLRIAAITVFDD